MAASAASAAVAAVAAVAAAAAAAAATAAKAMGCYLFLKVGKESFQLLFFLVMKTVEEESFRETNFSPAHHSWR